MVGFIERNNLFDFLGTKTGLLLKLFDYLATETMAYQLKLIESYFRGSKQRISRILLRANEYKVNISREDLAQMAGVTYKTAIKAMKNMESRGIINASNGKILVNDRDRLRKIGGKLNISGSSDDLL